MLSRLTAVALIALAAGCSSHPVVYRSGTAPLTDLEAARLGRVYMNPRGDRSVWLHSMERQGDGYMLAYTTPFDQIGQPPKESRLIVVHDDGTIREIDLKN